MRSAPIVLLAALCACAEIILQGPQDGEYERAEYLVTQDIIIEQGRTMSLAPGSILRFRPNVGMVVHGALVCKGTPTAPNVFTSYRNRPALTTLEPKPFDWTGITVKGPSGAVYLDNAEISYSTFGVLIDFKRDALNIRNTIFQHNGDRHLSIANEIVPIDQNMPYTFTPRPEAAPSTPFESTPVEPKTPRRETLRKLSIAAAIAGGVLCIGSVTGFSVAHTQYKSMRSDNEREDEAMIRRVELYGSLRSALGGASVATGVLTAAGLMGIWFSYRF